MSKRVDSPTTWGHIDPVLPPYYRFEAYVMADHHDDHHDDHHGDDHAVHQAPWVATLTIAICVGFTFFMIGLKLLL